MSLVLDGQMPEWTAAWAWSADRGGHGLTVRLFRCRFVVAERPASFRVAVSADSRYRLWLDGVPLGRGPLKGTLEHYHFETYELAPLLQPGEHVLAAEVRWFGVNTPVSEVHSPVPGWLVQGPPGAGVDTPDHWRVFALDAVSPDTTHYIGNAQHFLNHTERVEVARWPRGWEQPAFDDAGWEQAVFSDPVEITPQCGVGARRELQPRDVPLLIEEPRRFVRSIQNHREVPHRFGATPAGWSVPAGEAGEILLDAGALTTGYPELVFEGGAGRTVEITYAECLGHWRDDGEGWGWHKGVRDDLAGEAHGYRDTLRLDGGAFCYEPFHWRTFWFVRIVVSAGPSPVVVHDVRYRYTTFPQDFSGARFESSDPQSTTLFRTSVRTLELCAHETYEDCPYYEQLNYIADTRLQILASYHLANDSRLARRTLRLYRDSLRPDGLVGSRVPSVYRQILPYFALIYVLTVEDYWRWTGDRDRAFVRSCLLSIDGVLWFFRERLRADGYVGRIPPWSMVDRAPDWDGGMPPAVRDGESTYLTCLYILALEAGIRLHHAVGEPSDAVRWEPLPERLRAAVRATAWSEAEGLYLEGPGRLQDGFSQHAQCLAILSGTATPAQARRILKRLSTDPALRPMHLMQSFYLARALEAAGGYGAFHDHVLERWRRMLRQGVSTWQEYPDPTRSDCHAWSSWIAVDFVSVVLGIRPGAPGWKEVCIQPLVTGLEWARGAAPTPAGPVEVEWRREGGRLRVRGATPPEVPVVFRLPGCREERRVEGGPFAFDVPDPEPAPVRSASGVAEAAAIGG
jgi:alpha-L-rhamnosidase